MAKAKGKKCPLCIENGLMRTILAQDDEAYLCRRVAMKDGQPVAMENEYMLVPKRHGDGDPLMWLYGKIRLMCQQLDLNPDNLYVNLTQEGGRELDHPHIHLIVRTDGRRLGMNGLIALVDLLERRNTELEQQVAQLQVQVEGLQADLVAARRRSGDQLTGF